jgi:hypothetical protein
MSLPSSCGGTKKRQQADIDRAQALHAEYKARKAPAPDGHKAKKRKSLHRMLSPKGNPSMDNLAAIFGAVRKRLKVELKAHTVKLQKVA